MQDMIDSFHIFCSDDGIISAQRPKEKSDEQNALRGFLGNVWHSMGES